MLVYICLPNMLHSQANIWICVGNVLRYKGRLSLLQFPLICWCQFTSFAHNMSNWNYPSKAYYSFGFGSKYNTVNNGQWHPKQILWLDAKYPPPMYQRALYFMLLYGSILRMQIKHYLLILLITQFFASAVRNYSSDKLKHMIMNSVMLIGSRP